MPLTTGKYFGAILLAVTPTALGGAVNIVGAKPDPTEDDWKTALARVGDSDAVNAASMAILTSPEYQPIIDALRKPQPVKNADGTPVQYNDGTNVMVDHASRIRDIVWNHGPWTGSPPHPSGPNFMTLLDTLNGYKEA